jgi:hypothetical protein
LYKALEAGATGPCLVGRPKKINCPAEQPNNYALSPMETTPSLPVLSGCAARQLREANGVEGCSLPCSPTTPNYPPTRHQPWPRPPATLRSPQPTISRSVVAPGLLLLPLRGC